MRCSKVRLGPPACSSGSTRPRCGGNSGTGDLNDDRTTKVANELIARDIDDDGTDDYTLTYDAVGNLTDDGQYYTYVYDAFGRLVEVKVRSSGDTVSEYAYNGLGWRIMAINDSNADGSLLDETPEWMAYDERWRLVAIYDGAADPAEPREQYVHHNAGLDGRGRSRRLQHGSN